MPNRGTCGHTRGETSNSSERDRQAAAALVTAGALVAIADRHADTIEREEVVRYINDRQLVPAIPGAGIARLFDERAHRLEQPDFANVVIEALRPASELSLSSEIVELAERVAVADSHVHSYEWQALSLIRLITMSVPKINVATSALGSPRTE